MGSVLMDEDISLAHPTGSGNEKVRPQARTLVVTWGRTCRITLLREVLRTSSRRRASSP